MEIVVNGENLQVPNGISIVALLELLGISARGVAVEVNRELVARAQHAECALCGGDHVEIVTLVGGG